MSEVLCGLGLKHLLHQHFVQCAQEWGAHISLGQSTTQTQLLEIWHLHISAEVPIACIVIGKTSEEEYSTFHL